MYWKKRHVFCLILPSKHSIVFWNSLREWLPDGARTWTQTWTLPPDQRIVKVLSAPKSQNKLCGVWIIFRSVENAEIEDIAETISTLIPRTGLECLFGAEYRGQNPVFFTGFSPRGSGFFPRLIAFFLREKSEGKIRRIRGQNPVLSRTLCWQCTTSVWCPPVCVSFKCFVCI